MKQKLWLTVITGLAYCIDKELYKAIDYFGNRSGYLLSNRKNRINGFC
jgi:hypothetical protein